MKIIKNKSKINANYSLYKAISGSTGGFTLNSQETITSDYVFVRPRSSQYNYSENPSFISGSTGEVIYNSFKRYKYTKSNHFNSIFS